MIERLLIQNFQTHDKLRVNFGPGITCIVGPSDIGKSAILRALRWVCTNQPGGDAFVRHGAKGTTVRLVVDNHTITRNRSSGGDVNEYRLGERVFHAFGRGVPEPIERLLNLGQVCWQGQHDAPYWFGDTAGEVSRQLNTIVNLGIIDDTLANVARALHRARTKLELSEEELTQAKRKHDETAWVPEFDVALEEVEEAEAKARDATNRSTTLAEALQAARMYQATHNWATGATEAGQTMVSAAKKAMRIVEQGVLVNRLVRQARQLSERLAVPVPSIESMEDAFDNYQQSISEREALRTLIDDIRTRKDALCLANTELEKAERALPKRCPACGQSL